MLERFRQFRAAPEEKLAVERLCSPSHYPGLEPLQEHHAIMQLYVLPSFQPTIIWTLFKRDDGSYTVRRVRWDFSADYRVKSWGLALNDPTTYGTDALCSAEVVEQALARLAQLSVPAWDAASNIGTDGVTFGFRRRSFSQSLEFSWWCHPPRGCETIASWYHGFIEELESLLPAHTDHFRLSAIRP